MYYGYYARTEDFEAGEVPDVRGRPGKVQHGQYLQHLQRQDEKIS